MAQTIGSKRPKYLNLIQIRLPVPGVVSILHRISGVLLIYFLPFLVWALAVAVDSPAGYDKVAQVLSHPLSKLLLLGLFWATMHHFCAGIRFLLLEMHVGLDLATTRLASWIVLGASVLLTLLCAAVLL